MFWAHQNFSIWVICVFVYPQGCLELDGELEVNVVITKVFSI